MNIHKILLFTKISGKAAPKGLLAWPLRKTMRYGVWTIGSLIFAISTGLAQTTSYWTETSTGIAYEDSVGVGTDEMRNNFVVGTNTDEDVSMAILSGGQNNAAYLFLGTPYQNNKSYAYKTAIIAEPSNGWSRAKLHFSLVGDTGNETDDASVDDSKMTIDYDGNVGIGTTSPEQKLDVAGAVKADSLLLGSETFTETHVTQLNDFLTNVALAEIWIGDEDGYVGLGTDEPSEKLEVIGGVKADSLLLGNETFTETHITQLNGFLSNVALAEIWIGEEDGYVGLGTDEPSEKLEVVGAVKADSLLLGSETLTASDIANIKNVNSIAGSFSVTNTSGVPLMYLSANSQHVFIGSAAVEEFEALDYDPSGLFEDYTDDYSLWVSEGMIAEGIHYAGVDQWADFVFEPNYKLSSLEKLEAYIQANGHLPALPSEAEVKAHGYNMNDVNVGLLQSLEEMTLHTIEQQKQLAAQQDQLNEQAKRLEQLAQRLEKIEADK